METGKQYKHTKFISFLITFADYLYNTYVDNTQKKFEDLPEIRYKTAPEIIDE